MSVVALALAGGSAGATGSLDPSFGTGGTVQTDFGSSDEIASGVVVEKSRKIVAAGSSTVNGSQDFALARYKASGDLDASFGTGGKVLTDFGSSSSDAADDLLLQPDGRIVAAGVSNASGNQDFALARYKANGNLDPSFGTGGKVVTDFGSSSDDEARDLVLQPDGKIVVAGFSRANDNCDFALARYTANGSLDASFGTGGKVLTDFGSSSEDCAFAVVLQPDGRIVAAGFSTANGGLDFALARYKADGDLDTSFGTGGTVLTDFGSSSDQAFALSLQPDGRILVAGDSSVGEGVDDFALARYDAAGNLDASFGSDGKVLTDFGSSSFDYADSLALQADGRIVVAGISATSGTNDFALARYDANGSLDPSFGGDGKVVTGFGSSSTDEAKAVALQPDGRIVAAGFSAANDRFDFALARYLGS